MRACDHCDQDRPFRACFAGQTAARRTHNPLKSFKATFGKHFEII